MNRRTFLKTLAAVLPASLVAKLLPAAPAAVVNFRNISVAAMDAKTFDQLLGDAITRRMVRDYQAMFPDQSGHLEDYRTRRPLKFSSGAQL